MSRSFEAIAAEALTLDPEDRIELAQRLIASVFYDDHVEKAWAEEIERRIAAIESGTAQPISRNELIARLRASIDSAGGSSGKPSSS